MRRRILLAAAVLLCGACVPGLTPLVGRPVPTDRLPRSTVAPGHHKIVFSWELADREMTTRGDGAAQIAAPDSVRLDFFLAGGFGAGQAILVGDSLQTPPSAPDLVRRLIPPPTLLWAALGRVALLASADTVVRSEGSTLRADFGRPVAWRLSFRGDTLTRAERVEGGRVTEWVERPDASHIRYWNAVSRRSLQLLITRAEDVPDFDASIWRFGR